MQCHCAHAVATPTLRGEGGALRIVDSRSFGRHRGEGERPGFGVLSLERGLAFDGHPTALRFIFCFSFGKQRVWNLRTWFGQDVALVEHICSKSVSSYYFHLCFLLANGGYIVSTVYPDISGMTL